MVFNLADQCAWMNVYRDSEEQYEISLPKYS
jgi:hypothetical protein